MNKKTVNPPPVRMLSSTPVVQLEKSNKYSPMTEREHKKLTIVQKPKEITFSRNTKSSKFKFQSPQNCRFSPMEVST